MTASWKLRSIGSIATVIAGQSPNGRAYNEDGNGLAFHQGKTEFGLRFIGPPKKWTTEVTKTALPGDILISVRAPVGPINETTEAICIGRGLAAIRPHKCCDKNYLWYALLWLQPSITGKDGAVFPSITRTQIDALEIPLPPIEEQRRIVAMLDEAFEGLEKAKANSEANLANSQELFVTSLETTFTSTPSKFRVRALHEVGNITTGNTPLTSDQTNFGDYIPFITPADFESGGTLNLRNRGLSEVGASVSRIVPSGSALMVCIGATIGKAAHTACDIASNQQINALTPVDGLTAEYIYFQFIRRYFQNQVIQQAGQATLPIINKTKWSNLAIQVPKDYGDQNNIIAHLREIGRSTENCIKQFKMKLTSIETIKQSLLDKVFSGSIT